MPSSGRLTISKHLSYDYSCGKFKNLCSGKSVGVGFLLSNLIDANTITALDITLAINEDVNQPISKRN